MNAPKIQSKKQLNSDSLLGNDKILSESESARKDIEKSYNLESINGTEAYYSSRYGWTLRKTID
tara:strand:+ start:383 stop:574 length:192 start_codon:yes stop_codon:yes gene_type:complete